MNETTAQLAIDVKNITRNFKGKLAVDNLSLEVKQGEIYAFLGPNGAGKSTTVKILITLLESTGGQGSILGYNIKTESSKVRLIIGVALQEASLDESQTGIEFLRLQGRLYGLTSDQISKRIEDLKPLIDIGDALKQQIKTYSGGMKRRLDLAASIIHNPKVLFLDEPTTGLDPISRAKVWQEINRLNKELGMTIFLTTQYLEEADQLADRVGIISGGRLVAEGTPKQLKDSISNDVIIARIDSITKAGIDKLIEIEGISDVDFSNNELIISTKSGANTIGKVAVELNNQKIKLESLTLRATTLDDVFLEVTGNRLSNKELN
jgi:ABC-2 type transport system ATP-binding protein